jgi:hypothetical protein
MSNFTNTLRSLFFIAAFFISALSYGQSAGTIGLGVKAGDPTGLTAKFYRSSMAIELVIGRPYYFSGHYNDHGYYVTRFDKYDKYNNGNYFFNNYRAYNPMAVQLHFLKSKSTKSAKELKLYYGGGPQLRSYKVEYFYSYRDYYGPKGGDFVLRTGSDVYTNIDLGLDGVFGLEYTFSDLPLSLFADANLFLELVDEVNLSLQGGLGVRFNIK